MRKRDKKEDMHQIIHKCQVIIVTRLADKSPEASVLLAKKRVDEDNLVEVQRLAQEVLSDEDREIVLKAIAFMKRALAEICESHGSWAINIGYINGNKYDVSPIDSRSLALEGLYKAAIRFTPVGNFRSYAASWIRQCVQRYAEPNLVLTLNQPMKEGENTTFLDNISADDVVGCNSSYYASDPYTLEELRAEYCPHLSYDEVKDIIQGHLYDDI